MRKTYGVGGINDTVADVARKLVMGKERVDEGGFGRVSLVPKREVRGRVQEGWLLLGCEFESVLGLSRE